MVQPGGDGQPAADPGETGQLTLWEQQQQEHALAAQMRQTEAELELVGLALARRLLSVPGTPFSVEAWQQALQKADQHVTYGHSGALIVLGTMCRDAVQETLMRAHQQAEQQRAERAGG